MPGGGKRTKKRERGLIGRKKMKKRGERLMGNKVAEEKRKP